MVILEALWGHFGYIRMALCHFTITLESLWSHFGCMRVEFQKTCTFPIDVNDFIQLLGHLGVTLGPIFVEIMEDKRRKVKNGAQKWHVDVGWHL